MISDASSCFILDPCFKTKYLEQLSESELLNTIVDKCMNMCNECQQQKDTSHTTLATSDLLPVPKKCSLGSHCLRNMKLKSGRNKSKHQVAANVW